MTTTYRDYCIDPRDLTVFVTGGDIALKAAELCVVAEQYARADSEAYHSWVSAWREVYNQLSQLITFIRKNDIEENVDQSTRQVALNNLRKIANTMLNARQFARDFRRARRAKA